MHLDLQIKWWGRWCCIIGDAIVLGIPLTKLLMERKNKTGKEEPRCKLIIWLTNEWTIYFSYRINEREWWYIILKFQDDMREIQGHISCMAISVDFKMQFIYKIGKINPLFMKLRIFICRFEK